MLAVLLLVLGYSCWRALLPVNREQVAVQQTVFKTDDQRYSLPYSINVYDDVVTRLTAFHFARDGFWRSHFLPNRSGSPNISRYDFTHTQCETLSPRKNVLRYRNDLGQEVEMLSLNNDCIYTHYPPLADWVFGTLASVGFGEVHHYKLAAIVLNLLMLTAVYGWLRQEAAPWAAAVAVLSIASSPAILGWIDTLYFQPFIYLLLFAGVLSWLRYLRSGSRPWFWAAWGLYLLEALSSYEMTAGYGVVIFGLWLAERERPIDRGWFREIALQGLAPVAAFSLQLVLRISSFGLPRTLWNLRVTLVDRIVRGPSHALQALALEFERHLLPWQLMALAAVVVFAVRCALRLSYRRPLVLLGTFLLAASSFALVFPGAARVHTWMIYRHFLPFAFLLTAYLAEAVGSLWLLRTMGTARRAATLALATVALGCFGWVLHRNLRSLSEQTELDLTRNRLYDPANLVTRALDVTSWSEGAAFAGLLAMPSSGLRVRQPLGWFTDFHAKGPRPFYYEIWWLTAVRVRAVRLLVDQAQARDAAEHCAFSGFTEADFQVLPANLTVSQFRPKAGEEQPRTPYTWLDFSLTKPVETRGLRLACRNSGQITLRQIEVFDRLPRS